MNIGVIVVAYRSKETISQCVRSCLQDPEVGMVAVIDNSSDDETELLLRQQFGADPRVVYRPSANRGFAHGCNLGASLLPPSDWIAFVNPDVILSRTLGELCRLASRTTFAATSALLPGSDGIVGNIRHPFSLSREIAAVTLGPSRVYQIKPHRARQWSRVGQLAGALVVMPRPTFQHLGGFDERFELYYEDVDLALRLTKLGGSGVFMRDWGVHLGGHSSDKVPQTAYIAGRVSRIRLIRKFHGAHFATTAAWLIGTIEWISRSLARRPEGQTTRNRAWWAQIRELRRPDSVGILQPNASERC